VTPAFDPVPVTLVDTVFVLVRVEVGDTAAFDPDTDTVTVPVPVTEEATAPEAETEGEIP
jgi:hypothetical protein